jgi:sugar/nucleoside kinase (ribokinase family)
MTAGPAPHRVLCLGRTYCDIIFTGLPEMPALGRERFAQTVTIAAGGGAFITAAHLAALGRPASLVTRLGTDLLSRGLFDDLRASAIDLTFVETAADAGPQPTVALVWGRERAFVSRRAGSSRPSTLENALATVDVGHLHIAEFATLADNPGLVDLAHDKGITVSLDPSWDDALIRNDDAFFKACAGIDVFFPNLEEGLALTGETEPAGIVARLREHFPLVVLKLGERGALAATDTESLSSSAPAVSVVDTTGAGDAFNAGFLHAWLQGRDTRQALESGIRCGSIAVQSVGGAPRDPPADASMGRSL